MDLAGGDPSTSAATATVVSPTGPVAMTPNGMSAVVATPTAAAAPPEKRATRSSPSRKVGSAITSLGDGLAVLERRTAEQDPTLEPVARSTAGLTLTRLEIDETVTESWSGVVTGPEGSDVSVPADDDVRYRGTDRDGVLAHWRALLVAA